MELVASKIATWELSAWCIMKTSDATLTRQKVAVQAQWTPRYTALPHAVPLQPLLSRLHTEKLAVMLDEVCALCIFGRMAMSTRLHPAPDSLEPALTAVAAVSAHARP